MFERLHSVNVKGTIFCYQHAAKQMIKQGRGGRIIGAASIVAKRGRAAVTSFSFCFCWLEAGAEASDTL